MDMVSKRITADFFQRDTLIVAQDLPGQFLVRQFDDGCIKRYRITETEAYCGMEDKACHTSKGRTARTEVMFQPGGSVYVYLIYGMYWMLNFVTGHAGEGTAVLIRGLEGFDGPGKVGRELQLDKSFYGEDLEQSTRLWLEEGPAPRQLEATPRIGIAYAGEPWVSKPWRFRSQ
ncbi:DNA-3-methyladenine glycosylase [Mangrovibacterium marinum]|uniref:Putative 3-methyladenine DNA glycosylase n=1 Tax=Mangrovibacterium marinum TaxID=1639118 RepID=A0A2T5C0V7_9BACT|nr:DNA-3-methyladenine glycosylase [Mangrovibacterium marinum]PTN08267.1 DNA-3-methyladenine glycosylase [Mangrovibacterium marinum]